MKITGAMLIGKSEVMGILASSTIVREHPRVTGYSEVMPAEAPDTDYAKISFTFSRTC
jgi:hypothetical protein